MKRNLKRAADMGYTFYLGPELEYFYFRDSNGVECLDQGGYFDMTPLDAASDLRMETVLALEEMGIGVENFHHEVAASQHEINLRFADALTIADSVMTCRLIVKEIALQHEVYATFMPKPASVLLAMACMFTSHFSKAVQMPSLTEITSITFLK